jgi:hypothetical protein
MSSPWDGVVSVALREDLMRTMDGFNLRTELLCMPQLHGFINWLLGSGSYWPHSDDPADLAERALQQRAVMELPSDRVDSALAWLAGLGMANPKIDNP